VFGVSGFSFYRAQFLFSAYHLGHFPVPDFTYYVREHSCYGPVLSRSFPAARRVVTGCSYVLAVLVPPFPVSDFELAPNLRSSRWALSALRHLAEPL